MWFGLLLVSLIIHLVLSWRASQSMIIPAGKSESTTDEVEVMIDLADLPEKDELVFEESIEFEPPPVLVPSSALAPPPPDVDLAMEAAAGGQSSGGFSAPLLDNVPVTSGQGIAGYGTGIGTGLSDSANRFAAYVQGLRETGLDVVFVVDTTGSMEWVLDEVNERIIDIVDAVRLLVPVSRFGVVAYRDFGEPGYVTKLQNLTFSLRKLMRFLGELTAVGGGSHQEAVYEGVRVAIDRGGWRLGAQKVIIVIGDAPPHNDAVAPLMAAGRAFAQGSGQISALDVSRDANPALLEAKLGRAVNRVFYTDRPMLDYQLLAEAGGGIASTMDGDIKITRQLMSLIMGGQFAREMTLLLEGL
jgi:hypothetical protein